MGKIKEIWCMPHSHLDIGYTHPQPLLMELQTDYIDQAIGMCIKTENYPEGSQFCWTIEASCVLKKWLSTASPDKVNVLKKLIKEGRICVTALPMHTTPNCDVNEMVRMMTDLQKLKDLLETDIKVAINHDVNGQPWTLGQVLLDSGVDFYLTGINIHFGGIPFKRPAAFMWEMADGRRLHTFLGEHYSLFSQFMFTAEHSTERMHEGVLEYTNRLEREGYQREFAFLTATNPPLYDNNCPDLELPDLVRKYNEEEHGYKIRLVTAQMLRDRLRLEDTDSIPVYRGDWTDYWNFGCGSTARETRVSRRAKQTVQKAEVIENINRTRNRRYESIKNECYKNIIVFDEHTWGASQSVTEPDSSETYSQLVHKIEKAYHAADLSGYMLSSQMERLCENPHQSNGLEGIVVVNTSSDTRKVELAFPKYYTEDFRQLSALRSKQYVPYLNEVSEMENAGLLEMPPLSYKMIPFDQLRDIRANSEKDAGNYKFGGNMLETPYYQVYMDTKTGRIYQIYSKAAKRNVLNENSGYTLFEPIRETVDASQNAPDRETLFPRDVDLGNKSISQWNHDWKAKRDKAVHLEDCTVIREPYKVTIVSKMQLDGMNQLEQRISFYTYSSRIHMQTAFFKDGVYEPESVYFAVPLSMAEGWACSYDTAGEFVQLDADQLGNVCRDWLTVDTGVSIYENGLCVTLACPDAPLVQVGDFNFGKESHKIERNADPVLLAWPLNNYWNTNFCADQRGAMEFSYDLFVYEEFQPKQVLADGIGAQNPCVIGALAERKSKEGQLLSGEGNARILHIYPAKKENAMIVILKSITDAFEEYQLTLLDRGMQSADIVDVQENTAKPLKVHENKIAIPIKGHELKLIRITRM